MSSGNVLTGWRISHNWLNRKPSFVTTDGQSAQDQNFITVRQLRVCWCGALSMRRGRVCRLHLLLVLASAVILGSESRGTHDHILLSQIQDPQPGGPDPHIYIPQEEGGPVVPPGTGFQFRRLVRLAGLRRVYSNPPPRRVFDCNC
jgi:hypothetical protein